MNANLVLLKQNGKQKVFPIDSDVTVIGRRKNCDFRIPLESVSRRHCQVSRQEGNLAIRDLGSRNGTYLNGKKVEETTIAPGDVLKIGPVTFAFQINGEPQEVALPPEQATPAKKPSDQAPTGSSDDLQDSLADLDDLGGLDDLDDLGLGEDLDDLSDL